jgi:uncharacterized protein YegL
MEKTEIIFILDRSGSMQMIRKDAIGGFNSYIEDQKKEEGDAKVSLILFSGDYEVVYKGKDLKEVEPINESNYIPRGSTALLDAIGKTLNEDVVDQSFDKHLVVIMTDGEENSSKEYTQEAIKKITEELRSTGKWEFIYLGANQDAFTVASNIGIATSNSLNFTADHMDVSISYSKISKATSLYRKMSIKDSAGDILFRANNIVENELKNKPKDDQTNS